MTLRDRLSHLASALTLAPLAPVTKQDVAIIPVHANDIEVKRESNAVALLPRGVYGAAYEFFSPDGGRTMIEGSALSGTSLAFAAYWYVASRWRAQKIAEAPLMIVKEDQDSGEEEWLPDHELVDLLDTPSLDYDMGELLERTSRYLDDTAECIWVKDSDTIGRVARITPFKKGEFTVESDDARLFARFRIQTSKGPKTLDAERVCYFRDAHDEGWTLGGKSRLDVAMSWLRLGEASRSTIRDLLNNAVWPSAVVIPDKDWNPDKPTLDAYKQELEQYAQPGQRGRPFVQLGGGSFVPLSASIKDLVPTDVLNRVESVVSAVSGVPAIVLQFQIGMENSPWSQMHQARRMAYDDTIIPSWSRIERVLTRQLLRPLDEDKTHFVRFDRSKIQSLQEDRTEQVSIAVMMGRAASLNERRQIMGLEPVDKKQDPDGRADEIPELVQPTPAEMMALQQGLGGDATGDGKTPKKTPKEIAADNVDPAKDPAKDPKKAWLTALIQRKANVFNLTTMLRDEAIPLWESHAHAALSKDRDAIVDIVNSLLTDVVHKSLQSKARGKDSVMRAVADYFQVEGKRKWTKSMSSIMIHGAERSTAVAAADLNVPYTVLHGNAVKFAQREAGQLLSSVSKTTKQLVNDIIAGGLEENRSTREIAQVIQDATGFSKARATLIARTETTAVYAGAPVDAVSEFAKSTGRVFFKTWFGVMDAKERDEHAAMEGETVGIDENFSNGYAFPQEPNCRCWIITHEEEEE